MSSMQAIEKSQGDAAWLLRYQWCFTGINLHDRSTPFPSEYAPDQGFLFQICQQRSAVAYSKIQFFLRHIQSAQKQADREPVQAPQSLTKKKPDNLSERFRWGEDDFHSAALSIALQRYRIP